MPDAEGGPPSLQRVVLWGFMGSGKSVVGARLARRLGWAHVDLDREIVARAGRAIADIFHADGEAAFRRLEAEVTRELIARHRVVFSPGGGWVANPELQGRVPDGTLTVWLRASPEAILSRVLNSRGPERPLLRTADPEATVRELLRQREPLYARATLVVSTDGRSVHQITEEIFAAVRAFRAGPPSSYPSRDA